MDPELQKALAGLLNWLVTVGLPLLAAYLAAKKGLNIYQAQSDRAAVQEAVENGAKAALLPVLKAALPGTPTIPNEIGTPIATPESVAQYAKDMLPTQIARLEADPRALVTKAAGALVAASTQAANAGLLKPSGEKETGA